MGAKFFWVDVNQDMENNVGTLAASNQPILQKEVIDKLPVKKCNVEWPKSTSSWIANGKPTEEGKPYSGELNVIITKDNLTVTNLNFLLDSLILNVNKMRVYNIRLTLTKKQMKRLKRMCR